MILVISNSATAEETKDPAVALINVGLLQLYPWKYLFINAYIETVVNDFNVTAPRYEPFDRMLRSDMYYVFYIVRKKGNDCVVYFLNKITRTIPTPMMTMGLDKRFVAVDVTPCTAWLAELATLPIVLPAVFATLLIEPVTVPTNCPGIAMILFANPPIVPIICDGIPRMESRNIVLYIMEIKLKKKDDHIFILE